MEKFSKREKASITVEASLIMPIIIYTIMILYSFIQLQFLDYALARALNKAAIEFSYQALLYDEFKINKLIASSSRSSKELGLGEIENFANSVEGLIKDIGTNVGEEKISLTKLKNFNEGFEEFKAIAGQASTISKKIKKIKKNKDKALINEGTILLSRESLNAAIKRQVNKEMQGLPGYKYSLLEMGASKYFFDKKASIVSLNYSYSLALLPRIIPPINLHQQVYIEGFLGDIPRYKGESKSKEKEKKGIGYITEKGKRYHTYKSCYHINPKVYRLAGSDKDKYSPCQQCSKDWASKPLYQVEIYKTKASKIYHYRRTCIKIKHKISEIELEEAIAKGYSHCATCKKLKNNKEE